MLYRSVFDLRGSSTENAIVAEALDAIKFPFERLAFPGGKSIIGWADLNSPGAKLSKDADPLYGMIDGRRYILGVFYPGVGDIYIDAALGTRPELARTTVSAEIAHAVDEFLPLTDTRRASIMQLLHGGAADEHTWWEKVNYNAEYWSLVGEAFMAVFTYAYSDLPFEGAANFTHLATPAMGAQTRKIIGIPRTDETAPVQPEPSPVPTAAYVRFGKSKVFHIPTHYKTKTGTPVADTNGLRACKICLKKGAS